MRLCHIHTYLIHTHAYVKKLKAVGFTEEQAEVQTEVVSVLIDEKLATKHDLHELEVGLKRDMKELEMRMLIRLGAIQAAGIAIVAALVKLL